MVRCLLFGKELYTEALKPYELLAERKETQKCGESFAMRKPVATSTPLKEVTVRAESIIVYCYCGKPKNLEDPSFVFCSLCRRFELLHAL